MFWLPTSHPTANWDLQPAQQQWKLFGHFYYESYEFYASVFALSLGYYPYPIQCGHFMNIFEKNNIQPTFLGNY